MHTVHLAIDAILANAKAFNPRAKIADIDLRSALHALFDELARSEVDYLLVGVALLSFVEGRNTQDVDLIIGPDDALRTLRSASFRDRDFGSATFHGVNVDLLLTTNELFSYVRAHERTTISFDGRTIPSASREGLILLKLYALPSLYRQGKLDRAALYETDIKMLHQNVAIDDDRLLSMLAGHLAAHDVQELRNILEEQRRHRRFT